MQPPEISIVVPVFNEEPNLRTLMQELRAAMESYGRSYEIIAVDDGSRDNSFSLLRALQAETPPLRVIRLARNFGQNPALYAGFAQVRGRVVVTIDADLQNPPSDIPKLIAKLEEGYDVVQGWRESRQDNPLRLIASRMVNGVVRRLTKSTINDLGSGMKAYRREIVDRLCLATHHSRYLPAETAWLGVRFGEVKVGHRERRAGKSNYGLFALLRVNFDMIASISAAPVQIIGAAGAGFSLIGFAMFVRIVYLRLTEGNYNDLATISALLFLLAGVQMLCISLLCQYISRIYVEVQNRPYFIVDEICENAGKASSAS